MFILPRKNILIEGHRLVKDSFVQVPDNLGKHPYFQALVADGKILVSESPKKAVTAEIEASEPAPKKKKEK